MNLGCEDPKPPKCLQNLSKRNNTKIGLMTGKEAKRLDGGNSALVVGF